MNAKSNDASDVSVEGKPIINTINFRRNSLALMQLILVSMLVGSLNYNANARTLNSYMHKVEIKNLASANRAVQDNHGFMWFGSYLGLHRFNGYEIKSYFYDAKNPQSLWSNRIESVYVDPQNTLWVGTSRGLNRYDYDTDSFVRITSKDNPQFNNIDINDTFMDRDGILWIATRTSGVILYNPTTGTLKPIKLTNNSDNPLVRDDFWAIAQQKDGKFWLGASHGLYQIEYNHQQDRITSLKHYTTENSKLANLMVVELIVDNKDNIWIGTATGLSFYHQQNQTLSNILLSANNSPSITDYAFVAFNFDQQDNLWMGTAGAGAHRITPEQQQKIAKQSVNNQSSFDLDNLSNQPHGHIEVNRVFEIIPDSFNVLWILTDSAVYKLPQDGLKVDHLNHLIESSPTQTQKDHAHKTPKQQKNNYTDSLLLDSSGYQWFGNINGLVRYHPTTQSKNHYYYINQAPNSIPHNGIVSLIEDQQQDIWIGTELGLTRYNQATDDFTRFLFSGVEPDNINHNDKTHKFNNRINHMVTDNDNNLWLATFNGLVKFNISTEEFTFFKHNPTDKNSLAENAIFTLTFDTHNTLWLGHMGKGLSKLDLSTQQFTHFYPDQSANKNLSMPSQVKDIYLQDDLIWLVNETGLIRIESDGKVSLFVDSRHGTITYNAIAKHTAQTLWIATTKGLKSFDIATETFQHYTPSLGFKSSSYHDVIKDRAPNGKIYLLGEKGLESFNPNDIKLTSSPLNIVIDKFLLANQEVPIVNSYNNDAKDFPSGTNNADFTLNKNIDNIDNLTLGHQQNIFSFEFAAISTVESQHIHYAYRLKGFDDSWINTEADNRRATFTNIPAGDYQFEIKARRYYGQWSAIKTLNLTILSPWWQTNLAYSLYAVLIISGLWGNYLWRTAKIKARSRLLERQVQERTETISKLLSQKDRMFANISHEFRTPLTLILNPIQRLIDNKNANQTNLTQQQIDKSHISIKHNAQRLLRMVEQLLEFAKTESNHQQTGLQQYSLKHTLDYLIACFNSLFSSKNLTVIIGDYRDIQLTLKPDSLEIILSNLLSNAVKYTPDNGTINITIEQLDNQVTINIKDNGIGIAPEHQQLVFERFGRVEHHQADTQASTGIGLALVKELVTANGGSIQLTSTANQDTDSQGSCFAVTLPISTEANLAKANINEISNNSQQITALEINNLTNLQTTKPNTKPSSTLENNNQNENTSTEQTTNKPLILIIDDNNELRELISNILSPLYDCLLAENGKAGVELATQHLPDLVISDLMMPIMDGFEVLKALKSDDLTAHIPVVMLTAKGDAQSRLEGWHNHADEYLAKPFSDEELIARINNILAIRQLISQRYQKQFAQNVSVGSNSPTIESTVVEIQTESLDKFANQFSQKLETILQTHYQDEKLNVATIASEMAMSQRQLIRKTKSILAMTPIESIRAYRLQKAATLLIEGQAPSTIAYEVGFTSHSYFAACFKAQFGCTPSNYKKTH